jgi:hypothetical protein
VEHITLGEWMVSGTAVLVSLTTIILSEISVKLIRVTVKASQKEMSSVARNADDDMRDVALGYAPNQADEASTTAN